MNNNSVEVKLTKITYYTSPNEEINANENDTLYDIYSTGIAIRNIIYNALNNNIDINLDTKSIEKVIQEALDKPDAIQKELDNKDDINKQLYEVIQDENNKLNLSDKILQYKIDK